MKHPAPLFAFAAATLAGAFWLSYDAAPPPAPTPKPTPMPAQAQPVGKLTFADATLRVTAQLDRLHMLRDSGAVAPESVFMNVELNGADSSARANVAAVLVIDRSGSMAGDKIDNARRAAGRMLTQMRDGDQLAVVSYGSDVSVDLPMTVLNAQSRARAKRVIAMLEEGGGTHIDGGLLAARRLLKNGSADVGRVILISDGRPTEGERRSDILVKHAEELRLMGVTLSTLGVGLDYNEDLMQSLALGGGGRYHYLRRSHQLPAIVDAELRHASRIVARSVQLRIPAQLEGFDVVAVNGHATEASGTLEVRVGDIAADEVRNILLRLDVKPVEAAASSALQFAAPEVLYTVAADGRPALLAQRADRFRMAFADDVHTVDQHRAPSVRAQVLRMSTAQHLTSSMRAFAKGDVTQATQALSTRVKALNAVADETGDLGLRREAENVGRVLRRLEKAEPQSESGLELVKEQKARAFGLLY